MKEAGGISFTCTATSAGGTATETVTMKRDATVPAIGYIGNTGSYTVDQTVAITCSASDAMSGLASSTCSDVGGDAYSFSLGTNSFSAQATDNAGNGAAATASFTVQVTTGSLSTLTRRFVSQPGVANALCQKLNAAAAARNTNARSGQIAACINQVEAQTGKEISAAQAATLIRLARAL